MWRFVFSRGWFNGRRSEFFGSLVGFYAYRHAPFWFAVTAIAALRPVGTFADVVKDPSRRRECPFYGCPSLPQDVFFDKEALGALEQLRKGLTAQEDYNQALETLSRSGDSNKATLTLIGYKGGLPDQQINQDRAFVVDPFYFLEKSSQEADEDDLAMNRLLGVFDGHAKLGERVSEHSVQDLPKRLANKLTGEFTGSKKMTEEQMVETTKRLLVESFREVDKTAPAKYSGGCTASVVLQLGPKLFIANAGDSRSFVVAHRKSTNSTDVVYISREDKPDLPDEKARIEATGGSVYIPLREGSTSRVMYVDKRTGHQMGLAMSRSIGDWEAGKVGVIPDPIVDVVDLPSLIETQRAYMTSSCFVVDEHGELQTAEQCQMEGIMEDDVYIFAVSVTDGLLDYVEPEIIAGLLAESIAGDKSMHLLTACERLISIAATAWHHARRGRYRDDIAIAVSKIRSPQQL